MVFRIVPNYGHIMGQFSSHSSEEQAKGQVFKSDLEFIISTGLSTVSNKTNMRKFPTYGTFWTGVIDEKYILPNAFYRFVLLHRLVIL